MFHSARLKLTMWYLLIIMLVSLIFSFIIYIGVARELERGFHMAEMRARMQVLDIPIPGQIPRRFEELGPQFVQDFEEARKRVITTLLVINGGILFFSSIAGYYLAGETLHPIELVMEDQKRFIADASHELRTPLTALKTSLEVALRDKKLNLTAAKAALQSNLEDVDNLKSLSDHLLSLACYQHNGTNLKFDQVDMAQIINQTYRQISPLAKQKNLKVELKVVKQKIQAHKESLEEMLLIFLDNAVKYTPENGTVIVQTQTDNKYIGIKIKDTGVGISKQDLPHIFDRFYRADQSRTKSKVAGFGIGLSLAKRIIEIHKGTVSVNSQLGKGTSFIIKLPINHP